MCLKKKAYLAIFFILIINLSSAIELQFDNSGIQYFNISVPYGVLNNFTLSISGINYSGYYPFNLSIDIGDDGIIDWEYKVYDSNSSLPLNSVVGAWSNNISQSSFNFVNISASPITTMFTYGSLSIDNTFSGNGNNFAEGILGIDTASTNQLSSQILTVYTNNSIIHAFIPEAIITDATTGLYVTRGGSTYYCTSEHNSPFDPICDLTFEQAVNFSHVARTAEYTGFYYNEDINNPHSKESINNILKSCQLPCNISVKVSTQSAGSVNITNINMVPYVNKTLPANITIIENSTDYLINIEPYSNLTEVYYFYGQMPIVYIIPFEAEDENRSLSFNQTSRISLIQNNLTDSWDRLTNNSHPLDFRFYNITNIPGLNVSNNYSTFSQLLYHEFIPNSDLSYPAILVMMDVWDYYSEQISVNFIQSNSAQNLISQIYINGINNMPVTSLNNYNDEILINVFLHEIMHTFLGYPQASINGENLFYTYHPASFRDDNEIEQIYDSSYSPTGAEGYYEIYSIMNQMRVYLESAQISNTLPGLSALDKMLLGILSPDIEENYTFYSANITKQSNSFIVYSLSKNRTISLNTIYPYSTDSYLWDVRTNAVKIIPSNFTYFYLSKLNQDNQSLWVFAKDDQNQNHFEVFNLNAKSIVSFNFINLTSDTIAPQVTINSPISTTYATNSILINISLNELGYCEYSFDEGLTNLTLSSSNNLTFTTTTSLPNLIYTVYAYCRDIHGNFNISANTIFTISVLTTVLPGGEGSGGGGGGGGITKINKSVQNTTQSNNLGTQNSINSSTNNKEENASNFHSPTISRNIARDNFSSIKLSFVTKLIIVLVIIFSILLILVVKKIRKTNQNYYISSKKYYKDNFKNNL